MTIQEFEIQLRESGIDDATVKTLVANAALQSRVVGMKQQKEYDAIATEKARLEAELIGDGKTGAATYKQWYVDNIQAVQDLQLKAAKYEERYGVLDPNAATPPPAPAGATAGMTEKEVHALIQNSYGSQWSNLLKGSGKVIEKHIRAGRKENLDWDKLAETAAAKGGDLEAAYDVLDAPNREADSKAATEKEISRRVAEEVAKRNTQTFFPAGADGQSAQSGGITSRNRPEAGAKYDRTKVIEAAFSVQ